MMRKRGNVDHTPTVEEMADAAHELIEIAHAVAAMPHPPEEATLEAMQVRLVKATAAVMFWSAPTAPPTDESS